MGAGGEALLELEGVDAAYGPVSALSGVSLTVHPGEIVTLIGANGAGKTTLLMTLFGNPRAGEGKIVFDGRDITGLPTHRIARMGLSLVPEGRRVFSGMSVAENLEMGLVAAGERMDEAQGHQELEKIFTLFPRLLDRREQRAGTLSGGEQQMLAMGRALMSRPRLLLLDEPSLGLAPMIIKQIFSTLKEIAREGTTIFLVEQNANQALRLADRGYVLVNGRVRMAGSGLELLQNADVRKAYLGGH
ncbi:MAG: ABC transporter ATP-binding protein [Magnetococcales bacterium]|nr:ABC transporter ATP-binding protein [Magnetococcales bacterium]